MTSSVRTRRQVTLFLVDAPGAVEYCRSKYNPVQSNLIAAHVTLCREDEISDWAALENRVAKLPLLPLRLKFGAPVRDGNLVLLPVIEGAREFGALRQTVLADTVAEPRQQNAHVTIIHPRNGRCTDEIFGDIQDRLQPFETTFVDMAFIEQRNEGSWKTLSSFPMRPS